MSRIKANEAGYWDSNNGQDAKKKDELKRKEDDEFAKKRQLL